MIQHAIPQQISAFQFKLFGNLTIREFAFVGSGFLISFLLFISPLHFILKLPLILIFGGGGAALALLPIQGRSFDQWILLFFKAIFSPTQRIWRKSAQLPFFLQPATLSAQGPSLTPFTLTESKLRLEEYLKKIQSQEQSPLDAAEQMFLQHLDFETPVPDKIAVSVSRAPTREALKVQPEGVFLPIPQVAEQAISEPEISHLTLQGLEASKRKIQQPPKTGIRLAAEVNFAQEPVFAIPQPDAQIQLHPGIGQIRVRRLHSQPPFAGEIKLPIRGERRFELSDQLRKRLGIDKEEEKATSKPISQVNQTPIAPAPIPQTVPAAPVPQTTPKPRLISKIFKGPKTDLVTQKAQTTPTQSNQGKKDKQIVSQPKTANISAITHIPNVLSGIVIDKDGAILDNTIILVKNETQTPVRALKTNKLGQFVISTPLPNGKYTVEAEKDGFTFDIIEIQTQGQVMPPVEIRSR